MGKALETIGAHVQAQAIGRAYEGKTQAEIARALGVTNQLLWKARRDDPAFSRELQQALENAANDLLDHNFSELASLLRDAILTGDARLIMAISTNVRVRLENLKHYLERRYPAVFSPKQQIEVTHKVDLTQALAAAESRSRRVIDITPQGHNARLPITLEASGPTE